MLKIAVCDDMDNERRHLESLIEEICGGLEIEAELFPFSSGEEFLAKNEESPFDIAFMDIFMNGDNGIEVAKKTAVSRCRFVFTTTSMDFAVDAFNLNAAHYLLKPVTRDTAAEALRRCIKQSGADDSRRVLELKTGKGVFPVPMNKIIYIEVTNKVCHIYFYAEGERRCIQVYNSLNSLFEMLDGGSFLRAQQSYAVNMRYIHVFYYDRIVMTDGKEIILSRNSRSELKKQYQRFLFRMARGEDEP